MQIRIWIRLIYNKHTLRLFSFFKDYLSLGTKDFNWFNFLCIGLFGKFVPILKKNWNAEDLNFSIHLLNLNLLRHELSGQPNIMCYARICAPRFILASSIDSSFGKFCLWDKSDNPLMWLDNLATYLTGKLHYSK